VTIAALGALAVDFALLEFGGAAASVDSLARAYSISLCVGFVIAAALALRQASVRPRIRDIAIIVAATLVMAFALRPLNALGSRPLAAALAVVCGGGLYGAALLACDVAGLRGWAAEWLRAPRGAWTAALPPRC
jgi:Na+-translocating ferredoxin:NAD+ oxidoreductase RnfD subunit